MQDVERLDYSKPPPGYLGGRPDATYLGLTSADSLAAAWAHYKARHDPPGSEVFQCGGLDATGKFCRGWKFRFGIVSDEVVRPEDDARAAAWAWYDDALAIESEIFEHLGSFAPPVWPAALAWTADQRAAVRRWLTEGGEMPEVLRG